MLWYIEFVEELNIVDDVWIGYEVVIYYSKDGYGFEDGCIWSDDGKFIVLSC